MTTTPSLGTKPLAGIRVIELGRALSGPWSGQILADLGAEVIKVERPGQGDESRSWGPPFVAPDESAYFLGANRAKKSIEVDLSTPEGQQAVKDLAAGADVLIENFKAGALAKMGLSYDQLSETHPHLIYCSLSGFGQSGPRRGEAAYDFAVQAMGGLMSVTGGSDADGGGPQKVGVPIVDLATGMYGAIGILAALTRRFETGRGDWVSVAMLDVQVALLSNQAMNYLITGVTPSRSGNSHPTIQPQNVFSCRDGDIAIAVGNDAQFVALCELLDRGEWSLDPRFRGNEDRVRNVHELTALLNDRLRDHDRAHWVSRAGKAGVPCAPINRIDEVFAEPQVGHNGMVTHVGHPTAGEVPMISIPITMRSASLVPHQRPPRLGEHTDEVMRQLARHNGTARTREPLAEGPAA